MIRKVHFDVVFFHSRKFSLDHYIILLLEDIHGRGTNFHFIGPKPFLRPPGSSSPAEKILHHPLHVSIPMGEIPERYPRCYRLRSFFFSFLCHGFSPFHFSAGHLLAPQVICHCICLNLFSCPGAIFSLLKKSPGFVASLRQLAKMSQGGRGAV